MTVAGDLFLIDTHRAFFDFTTHYLASHAITRDLQVDDVMLSQFEDFLRSQKIEFTDKDINDNLDWIKSSIKAELFTSQLARLRV